MAGKISTGAKKSGQKYQNTTAFRHNKASKKTKVILGLPIHGLCAKCFDVIEWRKKFRKYKPLTAPKKCVTCNQKTVKDAYHVMCTPCATDKGVCAKCLESKEIVEGVNTMSAADMNAQRQEYEIKLRMLTERQRRTFLRKLDRGEVSEADLLAMDIKDRTDDMWGFSSDEEDDSEDEEGDEEESDDE
ncbi:hypothetical protein H9P43_003558 [Blastocladiella emersonii ATCC 22665]|nr:hypothetical protein H9P43_003558 [Blastocladiella emersonii ATCC 22665]